jgi:hypothetical protein
MPVPAWLAPCPIQSASAFWSVPNRVEPFASEDPGPEAPPVGNAWQVAQAASAISCEPGSALNRGILADVGAGDRARRLAARDRQCD